MVESVHVIDIVTTSVPRHVRNAFCASQRERSKIVLHRRKVCTAKRRYYGDAHLLDAARSLLQLAEWNLNCEIDMTRQKKRSGTRMLSPG